MVNLVIPGKYKSFLTPKETIWAIQKCKDFFSFNLERELNLQKISAPLLIEKTSGMSDVVDGHAHAVCLNLNNTNNMEFEIIRSVTKWKRKVLSELGFAIGEGIYAEILAIRPDEELSNFHSFQVDQWDWELVISESQRTYEFLKETVEKIYSVLLKTEKYMVGLYPELKPCLPKTLTFLSSEELLKEYPFCTSLERELRAAKKYGSIFVVGIGNNLTNGETHSYRAPDYDDWSTQNKNGTTGLNGDLIIWNPVLNQAMELSSMGIRVDKDALLRQVKILSCHELLELEWHRLILEDRLPMTIGGGIGVSRLCMFMLRKAHLGEVQFGIWPNEMEEICNRNGIHLLK